MMVREHVYDGERCTHCGGNEHDHVIYGGECVDREPMAYTTETGQNRCRHCGEVIEFYAGNVNAWVEVAEGRHYDQCPDNFIYEDDGATDVGGPHEPLRAPAAPGTARETPITQWLAGAVRRQMSHFHAELETTCRASLLTGHGVSVTYDEDGDYVIRTDPEVPFGNIYHYPKGRKT